MSNKGGILQRLPEFILKFLFYFQENSTIWKNKTKIVSIWSVFAKFRIRKYKIRPFLLFPFDVI